MGFRKIHHIAILSSNYEETKKFYVDSLGFEVLNEKYDEQDEVKKLHLRLDESEIEIRSYLKQGDMLNSIELKGLVHLGVEVGDVEDTVKKLKLKGIETSDIKVDKSTGRRIAYFQDPDGLIIELYEVLLSEYIVKNQYL